MRLKAGPLSVRLDPGGARLSATWAGVEAIRDCFPMVPLGNRVEGNSFTLEGRIHRFQPNTDEPLYLHGDGWLADWQGEATATSARLTLDHPAPAAAPHVYRAAMAVALSPDRLTVSLSVTNTGACAMPFGLGLHPFFARTPGTRVTAPARAFWSEGEGSLPLRPGPIPGPADFATAAPLPAFRLNNAYQDWCGLARIDQRRLRIDLAAEPVFAHLMVYAPEDDPSFFCLEPMTHLPNALARAGSMAILSPGETLAGRISFTFSQAE